MVGKNNNVLNKKLVWIIVGLVLLWWLFGSYRSHRGVMGSSVKTIMPKWDPTRLDKNIIAWGIKNKKRPPDVDIIRNQNDEGVNGFHKGVGEIFTNTKPKKQNIKNWPVWPATSKRYTNTTSI